MRINQGITVSFLTAFRDVFDAKESSSWATKIVEIDSNTLLMKKISLVCQRCDYRLQ